MLPLLPLSVFCLTFLNIFMRQSISSWRMAFLWSSLIWGALTTLSLELLSPIHAITSTNLAIFWSGLILLGGWMLHPHLNNFHKREQQCRQETPAFTPVEIFYLVTLGLIVGILAAIAWIAAPNNWDSMTYHLSRVAHWAQNQSLAFYPTSIDRQLHQPPFAELAITQFYILSNGSDRWANLIQWFSMGGSLISISLIIKFLGGKRAHQLLGALVGATLPMGILQATSTQNDYVLAFFIITTATLTLKAIITHQHICLAPTLGLSLGLALLTKGTAYFFAFPFMGLYTLTALKTLRHQVWKPLLIIGLLTLTLTAGHYGRNMHYFASPVYTGNQHFRCETMSLPHMASKFLKDISLHLNPLNQSTANTFKQTIIKWHTVLGINPHDKHVALADFNILPMTRHEDSQGNFLHLLLFFIAIALLIFRKDLRRNKPLLLTTICLILAYLLFFAIKWNLWDSRLQLSLFILMIPITTLAWTQGFPKQRWLPTTIGAFLFMASTPFLLGNTSRPLINGPKPTILNKPRFHQYFTNRPQLLLPFVHMVRHIQDHNCTDIALNIGADTWEYPFWVAFNQPLNPMIRIEHIISPQTIPNNYPRGNFTPCAIISSTNVLPTSLTKFVRTRVLGDMYVFLKDRSGTLAIDNLKELFHQANSLAKEDRSPTFFNNDIDALVNAIRSDLIIIHSLDDPLLEQLSPELKKLFENKLKKGMMLRASGIAKGNRQHLQIGQNLINQWNQWRQSQAP